jgi:gamma-glutamylcyclotransferase (GGCT)/AIG2-like uncharacterized protein YtfP
MSEYLFVYGSLRAELVPPHLRGLVQQMARIGAAYARGLLYDLGEYCGAVLDENCDRRIIGEVLELPDAAAILAALDQYEGFDCNNHDSSLFLRTRCHVILEAGNELECWVYAYHGEIGAAKLIVSGDYLEIRSHR